MDAQALELFAPISAFVIGTAIGSFLNVVIYRLPLTRLDPEELAQKGIEPPEPGFGVSFPKRSFCPKCKAQIAGWDNIPLLSYFILGGKCRNCRAPIPFRYFFVELLTGVLFALTTAYLQPCWPMVAIGCALSAAMVAVTFIDLDWQIIPDAIDIPGMLLAPVVSALYPPLHAHGYGGPLGSEFRAVGLHIQNPHLAAALVSCLGILVGAGIVNLIGLLGAAVFRKEAMGFGDVKLMGMIGGFLGWQGAVMTLAIGSFAGAFIGIGVKIVTRSAYIPFGPFLALGALVVFFWNQEIVYFASVTWPAWVTGHRGAGMPPLLPPRDFDRCWLK